MSEDLRHLECEVERQLDELAAALSVEPPPAVIERIRTAARQALDEAWLTGHPAPVPDDDTMARVRAAVHRELARAAGERARFSRRVWWLAGPAVAAAMIVIALGVVRYAGLPRPATPAATEMADQTVDLFVQAADRVWAEDPLIAALRMDVDGIEESLVQSRTTSNGVEEILEDVESRIDELFIEPEGFERTSRIDTIQPGAIG